MEFGSIDRVLVVCGLLLIWGWVRYRRHRPKKSPPRQRFPYIRQNELLSDTERQFLRVLNRAVGDVVDICTQVSATRVVKTISQLPRSEWEWWQKKLQMQSFDFLLLDREEGSLVCALELDASDGSEPLPEDFMRDLCHAAHIPFVRFSAGGPFEVTAVRAVILAHLPSSTDTTPIDSTATTQEIGLICPQCSSLLVRKLDARGVEFWSCSSAPHCTYSEPLEVVPANL